MIDYLPEETRNQVLKNVLYLDTLKYVHESQKSLLFEIIMKTGEVPTITNTGYIICLSQHFRE